MGAFDDLVPKGGSQQENAFSDLTPQEGNAFADLVPEKAPDASAIQTAEDVGRSVMAGGARMTSGAGWLLGQLGAEDLGQSVQEIGDRSAKWWLKGQSAEAREDAAKQFITRDEDGNYQWGDADFGTVLHAAAQSTLPTLLGMGAGGLATKGLQGAGLGTTASGAIGYGAGEAGVAAPQVGAEVYEDAMSRSHEDLMENSPAYRAAYKATEGKGGEQERREAAKEVVADAASRKAAMIAGGTTFAASAPAGALIGKIARGVPVAKTRLGATARGAGTEAVQEFVQSGAERGSQNIAAQTYYDPERWLGEGVLEEAVGGAAAGGLMGGVVGGAAGGQAVSEEAPTEDAETSEEALAENQESVDIPGMPAEDAQPSADSLLDEINLIPGNTYQIDTEGYSGPATLIGPTENPRIVRVRLEDGTETEAGVDLLRSPTETAASEMLEEVAGQEGGDFLDQAAGKRYEGGIDYMPSGPQDLTTTLGAAEPQEQGGIPYTPEAPDFGIEQDADRRVARDKRIQAQEEELGDVILPEGLEDSRLKRKPYRSALEQMAGEVVRGGDILKDYRAEDLRRTKSVNPQWFQGIAQAEGVSTDEVKNAVNKALAGKKLGTRQQRVVGSMLDEIAGEREASVDHAREELEANRRERRALREGFAPISAYEQDMDAEAGEYYPEQDYAPEWDAPTRGFFELLSEAEKVAPNRAEAIGERATIQDTQKSYDEAARELLQIINEASNEQETGREGGTQEDAREQEEGVSAQTETGQEAGQVTETAQPAEQQEETGAGQDSVSQMPLSEPLVQRNGKPYKTRHQALNAAKLRKDTKGKPVEAARVDGGWGIVPIEGAAIPDSGTANESQTGQESAGQTTGESTPDPTAEEAVSPAGQPTERGEAQPPTQDGLVDVHGAQHGNWELQDYERRRIQLDDNTIVADWDNAEVSAGSGQQIVNIFWLRNKQTGDVRPFGRDTAYLAMGLRDEGVAQQRAEEILEAKRKEERDKEAYTKEDTYETPREALKASRLALDDDYAMLHKDGRYKAVLRGGKKEEALKEAGWTENSKQEPTQAQAQEEPAPAPETVSQEGGEETAQEEAPTEQDEERANAILNRANVRGAERLDVLRRFREGEYSLEDLEAAYPEQREPKPAEQPGAEVEQEQPARRTFDPIPVREGQVTGFVRDANRLREWVNNLSDADYAFLAQKFPQQNAATYKFPNDVANTTDPEDTLNRWRAALESRRSKNSQESVPQAEEGADDGPQRPNYAFGGINADTADRYALTTAKERLAAGADAETVRQETGWFTGPDGKWRYEISDDQAVVNLDALTPFKDYGVYSAKLGDVLDHPTLYAAYPTLKDIDVGTSREELSSYSPRLDHITLSKHSNKMVRDYREGNSRAFLKKRLRDLREQDPEAIAREAYEEYKDSDLAPPTVEDAIQSQREFREREIAKLEEALRGDPGREDVERVIRSILLHEIQHAIQTREGFAVGGRPDVGWQDMEVRPYRDVEALMLVHEILTGETSNYEPSMLRDIDDSSEFVNELLASIPHRVTDREVTSADVKMLRDATEGAISPSKGTEWSTVLEELADAAQKDIERGKVGLSPYQQYNRLAGEVEARNVEIRQKMTAAERRAKPPEETADIPLEDVIVIWDGQEMKAAPENVPKLRDRSQMGNTTALDTDAGTLYRADTKPKQARTAEQVRKDIANIVLQWGENAPTVEVVETETDLPAHLQFDGEQIDGVGTQGVHDPASGTVYLVANALPNAKAAKAILAHEAVGHYGMEEMLGDTFPQLVERVQWLKRTGDKRVTEAAEKVRAFYGEDINTDTEAREIVAMLAEERAFQGVFKGLATRAHAAIREFLRKLGFKVVWSMPELDALIARAGRYLREGGEREGADARAPQFARRETDTESDAFRRWFGDSKVVDEDGEPLVVYHGTARGGFGAFDTYASNYGLMGMGGYFTENPSVASEYTKKGAKAIQKKGEEPSATVYPVYLAIQNPIDMEAKADAGKWYAAYSSTVEELERSDLAGVQTNEDAYRVVEEALSREDVPIDEGAEIMQDGLRNMGYDGLTHMGGGRVNADGPQHRVWVAFEPTQIKSAVGNRGTYDPNNPRINYARRPVANDLTSKQADYLGKIGTPTAKNRLSERWQDFSHRLGLKIHQGIADRYASLLDVDKAARGENVVTEDTSHSSHVLARMAEAGSGALTAMLRAGRLYYDPKNRVIDVQQNTRGLLDVLKDLGTSEELDRFMGWIAANRAQKLMAEGREHLFTEEEIEAGVTLNQGETRDGRSREQVYKEVYREFDKFRRDVLSIAVEAGIVAEEWKEAWLQDFYVPFYRIMEEEGEVSGPQAAGSTLKPKEATKKLKGGQGNLNDLLENTLLNFNHLLSQSLKNVAARQALENAVEAGVAEQTTEAARDKKASSYYFDGGQKVWHDISDPLVYNSLTTLASSGMNTTAMKMMRSFKRVFTNFVTITPEFITANLLRDTLQAEALADTYRNPGRTIKRGVQLYGVGDAMTSTRARMLATGGAFSFGHIYGETSDSIKYGIDKELGRVIYTPTDAKAFYKQVGRSIQSVWDKWHAISDSFENTNRAALFDKLLTETDNKLLAAYEARDLMDFSAHGAWPAVRFLTDVVPFMNARLQGLSKIYRSGVKPSMKTIAAQLGLGEASMTERQAARRFGAVIGSLTMATIALYLHNRDDEDYKELEEWQKDTYWFIKVGDDAFFLPKPFEVGAIATMAERLAEQIADENADGDLFVERLGHMFSQTFSLNPTPQMFAPLIDIYANRNSFTDRPIEGIGMKRLSPSLRAKRYTSEAAKGASKALETTIGGVFGKDSMLVLSPVQIDYLVQNYLGAVGGWSLGISNTLIRSIQGKEEPAEWWYEHQPVRRFYWNLDDPKRYTKYATQFYDGLREVDRIYSDIKRLRELGQMEEAQEKYKENKDKLQFRKLANQANQRLRKMRNYREMIYRNKKMSAEQKRKKMDLIRLRINKLTEMVAKKYPD